MDETERFLRGEVARLEECAKALQSSRDHAIAENTRLKEEIRTRLLADEERRKLEGDIRMLEDEVAKNTPLSLRVAALEKLLSRAMEWLEHAAPPAPDHHCGPESGRCDGGCVDYVRHWEFIDEIRAALTPESPEGDVTAADNVSFRKPGPHGEENDYKGGAEAEVTERSHN